MPEQSIAEPPEEIIVPHKPATPLDLPAYMATIGRWVDGSGGTPAQDKLDCELQGRKGIHAQGREGLSGQDASAQ